PAKHGRGDKDRSRHGLVPHPLIGSATGVRWTGTTDGCKGPSRPSRDLCPVMSPARTGLRETALCARDTSARTPRPRVRFDCGLHVDAVGGSHPEPLVRSMRQAPQDNPRLSGSTTTVWGNEET